MRRMKEMQMLQGMDMDAFPDSHNVVINTNNPIIANKLLVLDEVQQKETVDYLHKLALLNQNMLKGEDLANFVAKALEKVS